MKMKKNISINPKYPSFSKLIAHGKINTASTSKITKSKPKM
jgi:hypothetical protein